MEKKSESFIIYNTNQPNISLLSSSGKNSYWMKLLDQLQITVVNYITNKLNEQETTLFDFVEVPFSKMDKNQFYKSVKLLIEKIKTERFGKGEEDQQFFQTGGVQFPLIDKGQFCLSFQNICSIVNFLIFLIDSLDDLPKNVAENTLYKFAFNNSVPSFKDFTIFDQNFSKILDNFCSVKEIKISLSEGVKYDPKKEKYEMDFKVVTLFNLFFKTMFQNILIANVDFNIYPINEYFSINKNPYKITESEVIKIGKYYKNVILCNLVLMTILPKFDNLSTLKLKMYDSYQIELHRSLSELFDQNYILSQFNLINNNQNNNNYIGNVSNNNNDYSKNVNPNSGINKINLYEMDSQHCLIGGEKDDKIIYSPKFNNNYLYIQHLIPITGSEYYEFNFDFNSLDPLLFSNVNLLLMRYQCLGSISLNFFPKKKINKRKTLINNNFFNLYSENNLNVKHTETDMKIYYKFLGNMTENNDKFLILKEENLLNDLFSSFNYNLNSLAIILEKKLPDLISLSLNFSTYGNENIKIGICDNYNCSIMCFIFNLFIILKSSSKEIKLNSMEIEYDDFMDEKFFVVETIQKKIYKYKEGFNFQDLKINHIKFGISNISLFLPFENFPNKKLTELILKKLSIKDLKNLVGLLKKNKKYFSVLINLEISLDYFLEDKEIFIPLIKDLLQNCIDTKLNDFKLMIPFNLSVNEFFEIIDAIKNNKNKRTKYYLLLANSKLGQFVCKKSFAKNLGLFYNKLKKMLDIKKNVIKFNVIDNKSFNVCMNYLDDKKIGNNLAIIHCFNKILEKNNNNSHSLNNEKMKNIYENILYYSGGFKEKKFTIEIIN